MDENIIKIELHDELDLHAFHPKDVKAVLSEFIVMAQEKDIKSVRIVHGKGKSIIKSIVINELNKHKNISSYRDEPGNWGATIAYIKED